MLAPLSLSGRPMPELVLCLVVLGITHLANASLYDPHLPPSNRPFVEGWYARITDFDNRQSVGLLFGQVLPSSDPGETTAPLVLASILLRNCTDDVGAKCELQHVDGAFTFDELNVTVDGHAVVEDPDRLSPANFKWQVTRGDQGGYFEQVGNKTSFSFRIGDISLRGEATQPRPWNADGTGPEGWLNNFNLPLHWFVYSLGSELVSYHLQNTTSGSVLRGGNGAVHLEKNWGNTFPTSWIWSEGVKKENNASFALSGGAVPIGITVDAYLIGYRNPESHVELDFRPTNSFVTTTIDGCNGSALISIYSLMNKVDIKLVASAPSFSSCLFGPEARGFTKDCVESYDGTAEFTIYERGYLPWSFTIQESQVFTHIGLEFGGTHVCNNKCKT